MALSQELQEKLNLFNAKYGVQFNLEHMEDNTRKLSYLDSFMLNRKSEKEIEAEVFFKMVRNMMYEFLNAKTNLQEQGEYSVGDFNIETFVNEMEELVSDRNLEYDPPRARKDYGGAKYASLIKEVNKVSQLYNQSIYGVWAYKVLNNEDKLSFYDLKALTDPAVVRIDNGMESQTYNRGDLANVVYAREAMERVRARRSRWWRFIHPIDNYREKQYLKDLRAKVEAYKQTSHLPVESLLESTESLLKNAYEKGIVKEKEMSIDKKLSRMIDNPHLVDDLVDELTNELPAPEQAIAKSLQTGFLQMAILPDLIKEINRQNHLYFDALANNGDKEKAMENFIGVIFEKIFPSIGTLGYAEPKEMLVATQILLDVLLKKISPVAVDPELAKYAEGYVLNNAKNFVKYTNYAKDSKEMVDAMNEYNKKASKDENKNEVVDENANNKIEDKQVNQEEHAVNQQPASTAPDLKDPEFVNKFIEEMVEELPDLDGNYEYKDKVGLREHLKEGESYIKNLPQAIEDANKAYADGVAAGTDTTQLMKEYMNNVAPGITSIGNRVRTGEENLTLSMIQMMTDYVMKNYSPAAQNPEQWKDFAEGYYLKDLYAFSRVSNYRGYSAMSESKTAPAKYEELKAKKATAVKIDIGESSPIYNDNMPITEQVNAVTTAPGFEEKLLGDLVKILPDESRKVKNKDEEYVRTKLLAGDARFIKSFAKDIAYCNQRFDEERQESQDMKEVQKRYINRAKQVAEELVGFFGDGNNDIRNQIVLNYILKNYSPAAAAPEQWEEFTSKQYYGYNHSQYKKCKLEIDQIEQEERYEQYRQAKANANAKEQVPEIEHIVIEELNVKPDAPVSQPVAAPAPKNEVEIVNK